MKRHYGITLEDETYFLLKKLSKKTDIPISHLIEKAVLEKYRDQGKKVKKEKGEG